MNPRKEKVHVWNQALKQRNFSVKELQQQLAYARGKAKQAQKLFDDNPDDKFCKIIKNMADNVVEYLESEIKTRG